MADKKFAVFDIDGTLIRWQLYHAVVDKLAKAGALGESAHHDIHEARMRWKRREDIEGFSAYEQELIRLYEEGLASLSPQQFDTYAEAVIAEYKDQVYTYTRDLLGSLKQQGYVLLAISGSQQELVAKLAEHYGFDDYLGTQYGRHSQQFSGQKTVASHDKAAALKSLVKKHGLSFSGSLAVGDSQSDAAMLELVDQPIAFNPDKNLWTIAQAKGWPVVIERKNMVYELKERDGSYRLAQTNH